MSRQRKKSIKWVILFLIIIGILIAGFIYLKTRETPAPVNRAVIEEKPPPAAQKEPQQTEEGSPGSEKTNGSVNKEDRCHEIEAQVKEFFLVLDKQSYVRQIEPEMDTYQEFVRISKKLSKSPPSPAGEGLDPRMMAKNIFYFFRVLNDNQLRLIQEIMGHEEETLEMNLVVFNQWIMLGDQCPDLEEIRPSFPVLYSFAGFFINTIGGRAYLFRRPPLLRQLVSYYALLVIHEADRRGENKYGIDILPEVRSLFKEMDANQDLILRQAYLEQLNKMLVYYQTKRGR